MSFLLGVPVNDAVVAPRVALVEVDFDRRRFAAVGVVVMLKWLAICVIFLASSVQADQWIPEPEYRHPLYPSRLNCESRTVRINTYRVTHWQSWDGTLWETRTLIGVRYERETICFPRHHYHIER